MNEKTPKFRVLGDSILIDGHHVIVSYNPDGSVKSCSVDGVEQPVPAEVRTPFGQDSVSVVRPGSESVHHGPKDTVAIAQHYAEMCAQIPDVAIIHPSGDEVADKLINALSLCDITTEQACHIATFLRETLFDEDSLEDWGIRLSAEFRKDIER